MEWVGLEGTLQTIWFQPPCSEQGHLPPAQGAQSSIQPDLKHCRGGAATAPLGSLGQCFATLMGKNFCLISNLNLPSFSLEPFPLVPSLHTLVQSPSPPFPQAPPGTGSCSKVTPEPSLLQAEEPQLPQPVLRGEVLQPSDHLRGLLWPHSNTSTSF